MKGLFLSGLSALTFSVVAVPVVKAESTALNLSTLNNTSKSPIQITLRAESSSQLSHSTLDSAQRLNLTSGQSSIVPALNLSANQEAQTPQTKQSSPHHYKRRITSRRLTRHQRQRRLSRRRANAGGR